MADDYRYRITSFEDRGEPGGFRRVYSDRQRSQTSIAGPSGAARPDRRPDGRRTGPDDRDAQETYTVSAHPELVEGCAPPPTPVALRHRHDGWTPKVQQDFLSALAATASVTDACLAVRRSRQSAYALRQRADARAFAEAWDAALDQATQVLVDTAYERAMHGVEEHMFDGDGVKLWTRRRPDSVTLRWMIARRAPHRFGHAQRTPEDTLVEQQAAAARRAFPARLAGLERRDARMRARVGSSGMSTSEAVEAGLLSRHATGCFDAQDARRKYRAGADGGGLSAAQKLAIWQEVQKWRPGDIQEANYQQLQDLHARREALRVKLETEFDRHVKAAAAERHERLNRERQRYGLDPLPRPLDDEDEEDWDAEGADTGMGAEGSGEGNGTGGTDAAAPPA